MIPRYSLPEMAAVWSEEHKVGVWKEVESLALEGWAQEGLATDGAAAATRSAPDIDMAEWKSRETTTGHDLAAFVDVLGTSMESGGEWLHYGLTSSDVLDTALGVVLHEAGAMLVTRVTELLRVVKAVALEHRDTAMVGRTHGIWAEPTTFGLKLATWAFELDRDRTRLRRAVAAVSVGKMSGAVGTYAHLPPAIERHVCAALGLAIEPASSQITHRDRHAEFLTTLALVGASLERFATELRHLQRSEVAEVGEAFASGQKGSSSMPHKRNPIAAENITGLSRLLRGYAGAGLENVALWHERDISHSSVERVVLPDACLVLDFALHRMTGLVGRLNVDRQRMEANLEATRGLVYSQAVLLALIEDQGLSRDEAYRIVQRTATKAWEAATSFEDELNADHDVVLDPGRLRQCFDLDRHLANSSVVFERLATLEV